MDNNDVIIGMDNGYSGTSCLFVGRELRSIEPNAIFAREQIIHRARTDELQPVFDIVRFNRWLDLPPNPEKYSVIVVMEKAAFVRNGKTTALAHQWQGSIIGALLAPTVGEREIHIIGSEAWQKLLHGTPKGTDAKTALARLAIARWPKMAENIRRLMKGVNVTTDGRKYRCSGVDCIGMVMWWFQRNGATL